MAWYDLDMKPETKGEYLARTRYDNLVAARVDSLMELIGDNLPDGVQFRMVTSKSINAIVFIDYLLKLDEITEIYMAIYRMNTQSVRKIKEIAADVPVNLILSSFFRENKKYEAWTRDIEAFAAGNDRIRVVFAMNHAKVMIAKTRSGSHIVMEGSGNLSDNARIEQYLFENSKQMYEFHKSWMLEILKSEK